MSSARWWLAAGLLAARLTAAGPDPPGEAATEALQVGSFTLHRCETPAPWCGSLARPLDPAGGVPGTISIYFEFYPHTGGSAPVGTLVATEGGPGYPATESRDEYLDLFGPLRDSRDVVLMDNRGTGRSGAVDCHPLQTAPALTEANIARCGNTLGPKAPLYSVTLAADDLAAIRRMAFTSTRYRIREVPVPRKSRGAS